MRPTLPILLLALAPALPTPGPAQKLPKPGLVEPQVRAAFAAACDALPAPLRARLGPVTMVRSSDPGVPATAPLAQRLLGRGAHALFDLATNRVVVFDAALRGPRWGAPPPDAPSLATFLAALADLLGVAAPTPGDAASITAAWRAFAARVAAWPEARGRGIAADCAPGDAAFLDGFLAVAVDRSLGGTPPLDQLLLHELAHAVQLIGDDYAERTAQWATLDGWVRVSDGAPTDGVVGGMFTMEDPLVLIRLLLDGTRGDAAHFAPSASARFVNRYGRFDPREDFAECVRLLVYDPARLWAVAPAKLLVVDALGWQGSRDADAPGPSRFGPGELLALAGPAPLADAVRRLCAPAAAEPRADPRVVLAALRAHRAVLAAIELPAGSAPPSLPDDLPPPVRDACASVHVSVPIDAERSLGPPRDAVVASWERALRRWLELHEFELRVRVALVEDAAECRRLCTDTVAGEVDAARRLTAFRIVWAAARARLDSDERARLARGEVAFQRAAGRPALARAIELETGLGGARDGETAPAGAAPWDAIELGAALAADLTARGRLAQARAVASAMPGSTYGALRRVEALLALVDRGDRDALEGAAEAARACSFPELRSELLARVARAMRSAGRDDDARRALGAIDDPARVPDDLRDLLR
ncbi:MAG: hypothetical protein IPM29_01595 [Planctomycetes bacterium]|nr:hypothetical protein [Planctomycetota bacterium]